MAELAKDITDSKTMKELVDKRKTRKSKKDDDNSKKPFYKKWWFWAAIIIVALIVVVSSSDNNTSPENIDGGTVGQEENSTTINDQNNTIADSQKDDSTTGTKEQRNALAKAKSYATNMHMSKAKILSQLTSEYGEGFSEADAQWAIDHLEGIDWKKNALEKGKSYYDNMHMSKTRVYDQLTSEYGEQFTAEEAQYAVDNL